MSHVEPCLGPLTALVDDFTRLTGVCVDLPEVLFRRALLAGVERPG
jgi:hypothetical protein